MRCAARALAGLTALALTACGGSSAPPPPETATEDEARALERAAQMLDQKRGETDQIQEDAIR